MENEMKMTPATPEHPVARRIYRFAAGVVVACSGFLLLVIPLLALIGFPDILDDWFDVRGWQDVSGMPVFSLLGSLAAFLLVCGLVLVFITGHLARVRADTFNGLGLVGVGSLIAMVFLFPILIRPHEKRHAPTCTNNLRQLSVGVMMYMQDHGDRLPEAWAAEIDVSESTFICPTTQRRFHKPGGYGMNTNLPGKHYNDLQNRESLLLLADSMRPGVLLASEKNIALRHPPRQGYCCSYLDGSVELREAGETIRWK